MPLCDWRLNIPHNAFSLCVLLFLLRAALAPNEAEQKQIQKTRLVKNVDPTRLTFTDDADVAEENFIHVVENVEKRVEDALRDEVDLLFCHPGSVNRRGNTNSQTVNRVQADIKNKKDNTLKKSEEIGAKVSKKTNEALGAAADKEQEALGWLKDMFLRSGIDE
jgi:DhnA family fructose-bisphosphate aldolase class Ia